MLFLFNGFHGTARATDSGVLVRVKRGGEGEEGVDRREGPRPTNSIVPSSREG